MLEVLVTQLCPTLCDLMDSSPPGSSSMGFSRQEYWNGLPLLSPGDLPDPGIKPGSPELQVESLLSEPPVLSIYVQKVFSNINPSPKRGSGHMPDLLLDSWFCH